MKTILVSTCLILGSFATLFAQGKEISDEDQKQIQAEINNISDKIESTLIKDQKLYSSMKKELELISSLKDKKAKNLAIEKYSANYAAAYGQILAKSGINMKKIISDWNRKYTKYTFKLNNLYAVSMMENSSPPVGGYRLLKGSNTTTIELNEFLQADHSHCGGVGSANVTFQDKSAQASSTGVVATNYCLALGFLTCTVQLPADAKSITLKISGSTEVAGSAVAVLGAAQTWANSSLRCEQLTLADHEILNSNVASSIYCAAPVLWVAPNNSASVLNFSKEMPLDKYAGQLIDLQAKVHSVSTAFLCCGTSSEAKISITKAELVIER